MCNGHKMKKLLNKIGLSVYLLACCVPTEADQSDSNEKTATSNFSIEDKKSNPWKGYTALTIGDAYWTRAGFFPINKRGPVLQPEFGLTYSLSNGASLAGSVWANHNMHEGFTSRGLHEIDLGITYAFPALNNSTFNIENYIFPALNNSTFSVKPHLKLEWWEYGVANALGKSHPIIEPGIVLHQRIGTLSLEGKITWTQLLGGKNSNGGMLDTALSFPLNLNSCTSFSPTFKWTYLNGTGFYGSQEGTSNIKIILPLTFEYSKGFFIDVGARMQKGYNGKEDGFGGFLAIKKIF